MTRLFLTRQAAADIAEIDAYSIETWGQRVADEYMAKLDAAFGRLRSSPDLLNENQELSGRLLFYRVEKHLLACDRIGNNIYVLTVKHSSMDLPSRIAELEPQLIKEAELMHRRFLER